MFLAKLREWPVVQAACDAVGIERCTAYRARKANPELAEAWDEAMEAGIDRAEQEAFRRGVEGVKKGVWHQGVRVGEEQAYSDALLALVLKGRRKQVYAERTELTGADGGPVAMDDTTRAARAAQLLAAARARRDAEQFDDLA